MQQFYQRFHGLAQVTPIGQRTDAGHGAAGDAWAAKAQYLLTFAHQAAQATAYHPQVFGGILHYTARALAAYDAQAARATQAATQRAAADERPQREQYQAWEQHELDAAPRGPAARGAGGARSSGARPAGGGGHPRGGAAAGGAGGGRPGAGGAGRAASLRGLAADAGGVPMKPGASGDTHAPVAKPRLAWTTRPGGRARRRLVLGVLVCAAVVSTRWVRLNLSPSVPRGLYRLTAVREPLARGTLVVLPVPASVQPFHAWWVPLLKPVAAVAGDGVCVYEQHLWINGLDYGLQMERQPASGCPSGWAVGCCVRGRCFWPVGCTAVWTAATLA